MQEEVLNGFQTDCISFTCIKHEQWNKKFTIRTVAHIYRNNKQKLVNDSIRKEQVTDFKKRQRKKEPHIDT